METINGTVELTQTQSKPSVRIEVDNARVKIGTVVTGKLVLGDAKSTLAVQSVEVALVEVEGEEENSITETYTPFHNFQLVRGKIAEVPFKLPIPSNLSLSSLNLFYLIRVSIEVSEFNVLSETQILITGE